MLGVSHEINQSTKCLWIWKKRNKFSFNSSFASTTFTMTIEKKKKIQNQSRIKSEFVKTNENICRKLLDEMLIRRCFCIVLRGEWKAPRRDTSNENMRNIRLAKIDDRKKKTATTVVHSNDWREKILWHEKALSEWTPKSGSLYYEGHCSILGAMSFWNFLHNDINSISK